MGLYNFRDFLTFEDVADYLKDKGVYDFDLSQPSNRKRLYDFLKDLVLENKLSLVFRYYGRADLYDQDFLNDKRPPKEKINTFVSNDSLILVFDDLMLKDWIEGKDYLYQRFYNEDIHIADFEIPVYKFFGYDYHDYLDFNNRNHDFIILLDDNNSNYGIEPLFPKFQLENIFLQIRKDDLQSQINDIDRQLQDTELHPISQNTVTKILYALLKEHGYELGAKKGNTNEVLQALLAKHGVKLSRETISKWLDRVNDLEK